MVNTDAVLKQFLSQHPQFASAHWDVPHAELTVYFKDNPSEPYCLNDFIRYTPTWHLLTALQAELTGQENKTGKTEKN